MSGKFALIIGNSEYDDPKLAQLKTPDADVRALADVLRDPKIGRFNDVLELINESESVTRRAISSFFSQRKPSDLLLLYFSGHGVLDERGRLFLAVKDTRNTLLKATAISSAFITDDMDTCRSKRQILILDCCHSGAFSRSIKGQRRAVTQATFEGDGFGRVVLTASDSTQYAFEGDQIIEQGSLSLFTHYLMQGLVTGDSDSNGDGLISLDELYDYTYDQIVSQTPDQTPSKWVYKQQGNLIIAHNPKMLYSTDPTGQQTEKPKVNVSQEPEQERKKFTRSVRQGSAKRERPSYEHSTGSILQHESRTTGINLNTASPKEMIVVFKRTIEALRRLPDEVDLRQITKGAIDVIEADLRTIISGIDAMDYRNRDIYELLASRDAVLHGLRSARVELCVASDMLEHNKPRSIPNIIIKLQKHLSETLSYFDL